MHQTGGNWRDYCCANWLLNRTWSQHTHFMQNRMYSCVLWSCFGYYGIRCWEHRELWEASATGSGGPRFVFSARTKSSRVRFDMPEDASFCVQVDDVNLLFEKYRKQTLWFLWFHSSCFHVFFEWIQGSLWRVYWIGFVLLWFCLKFICILSQHISHQFWHVRTCGQSYQVRVLYGSLDRVALNKVVEIHLKSFECHYIMFVLVACKCNNVKCN